MTKQALVQALATELDISVPDADRTLTTLLDVITRTLAAGRPVMISNFGTWQPRTHPARDAYNPQTGATVHVPAGQRVRFVVSPRLRELVSAADPAAATIRKRPKSR